MENNKNINITILKLVLICILVMFILPLLTVLFVRSDAGMATCFILFYVVNPMYSIFLGVHCGKNIKKLWIVPILSSIICLISFWILFEFKEIAFVIYAIAYLILSLIFMLITFYVNIKINQ